jgi:hypothetical protein
MEGSHDPHTVESTAPGVEVDDQLVEMSNWLQAAEKFWKPCFERIREDAKFAYGRVHRDDDQPGLPDDGELRVNLVHATIQGLMPHC